MTKTILRIVFALLFGLLGLLAGRELAPHLHALTGSGSPLDGSRVVIFSALGAVLGVAVSPLAFMAFERIVRVVEDSLARLAPAEALSGAIGLVIGLIVSFFVKDIFSPFTQLPRYGPPLSFALYALITLSFSYIGIRVGLRQRLSSWTRAAMGGSQALPKLLDTSVIIDGRIVEIVQAGFIEGRLLVPTFVLKELQAVADSVDPIRRARGRRGLDVLSRLREVSANLEICDQDAPERDVDGKLVSLARMMQAEVVTNDYNLNRVARLQGVAVLNINELANALRPVVLPGEEMGVDIIKDGKEQHQGVGYLDDGTMIVVENGKQLIGEHVGVQVTSVLQTAAGRMIFAKLKR